MSLEGRLLALARAVRADGGDAVVRALAPMLREAAPFDAGELALAAAVGFERWTLTADERSLAAEDLLLHLTARRQVVRIDEPAQARPFRRTHAAMQAAGLGSLLAVPLATPGGLEGGIVLARAYPWAFVAAPLRTLGALAEMAALALEQSRGLARAAGRPRTQAAADLDAALRLAAEAEERAARAEAENRALRERLERSEAERLRLAAERDARRAQRRGAAKRPAPPESAPGG